MRIRARWTWVPLAITVAGVVYLSMVSLSRYQARLNEPQVAHDTPKPFVAPPPRASQKPAVPEPPDVSVSPAHPALPVIPGAELPPFRPRK